ALQRRARELGMVPGGDPAFLAPDGTVKGVPSEAAPLSPAESPMAVRPPEALATDAPPAQTPAPDASAGGAYPAAPVPTTAPTTPGR
ncbi:septum formation initiator family protein, partial [Streptomyces sp. NPDC052015]